MTVGWVTPYRLLTRALTKIDQAVEFTRLSNADSLISKSFGADFASESLAFMNAIAESDTTFNYSWAEPRFQEGNVENVNSTHAKSLVNAVHLKAAKLVLDTELGVSRTSPTPSNR